MTVRNGTHHILMLCDPEAAKRAHAIRLLNAEMHDASRLFAALRARRPPDELRGHVAALAESGAAEILGGAFEAWIDFSYGGTLFR